MSLANNMINKHGEKILCKTIDKGIEFGKIAGKKVLTKSAEATGDLVGNKIANKITNFNKKQLDTIKENENENQEIYITPERREQIIKDLKLF